MPGNGHHTQRSHLYFSRVHPTYIENWPPSLRQRSILSYAIPLNVAEVEGLLAHKPWRSTGDDGCSDALHLLQVKVNDALRAFPQGVFVRLGSRSPKDSHYALECGLRAFRSADVIKMFTDGSERVETDLRMALRFGYTPHLFIRPWLDIQPWAEFRCFVRNKVLVGISQYHCCPGAHWREIEDRATPIERAIRGFASEVLPTLHLDDIVLDVFLEERVKEPPQSFLVKLLDVNPFFPRADACLFSWRSGGDFDGSFRFL